MRPAPTHTLFILGSLLLSTACDRASAETEKASTTTASSATTSAPAKKDASPAASVSATAAASAQATPPAGTAVLGGSDWKAVFVGDPPMELSPIYGGGRTDDENTYVAAHPDKFWKFTQLNGGSLYASASKKALKIDTFPNLEPTTKTLDTWMKSGFVKDVKHTSGPEVNELGPHKVLALTGAGTCTLKGGEAADFYWYNLHFVGDSSHALTVVIVAKDASEEDKQVALTVLRQVKPLENAKPHYKKG